MPSAWAAFTLNVEDGSVLIAGRPAENERCHRCGKLLVPIPGLFEKIAISNYGGARQVTCLEHAFPRCRRSRLKRFRELVFRA